MHFYNHFLLLYSNIHYMHGVIDRAHARSTRTVQTTQIAAIYHAHVRTARSATQWLITVRLTSDQ